MKYKYSNLAFRPKSVDESTYSINAVFSTSDVDRHGEIVDQKSWVLKDFMTNPVVLFGHDHNSPPVGIITRLGYNSAGDLEGTVKFAAKEYPFAKVIWNLYREGFMKAFSVGFSSGEQERDEESGKMVLKNNVLYEISTVSVPANAMALAKSKGIDVQPLEDKFIEVDKSLREKAEDKAAEIDEDIEEEVEETEETEEVETEEKAVESEEEKECESCQKPKPESDASAQEAAKDDVEEVVEEVEETEEVTEEKSEEADEEKGALMEIEDEKKSREKKIKNFSRVSDLYYAFSDVYFNKETPVDEFPKLLDEYVTLLKSKPKKSLLEDAITSDVQEKAKRELEQYDQVEEEVVEETVEEEKSHNLSSALQEALEKGGQGSGNRGHSGRPGHRGGSRPTSGGGGGSNGKTPSGGGSTGRGISTTSEGKRVVRGLGSPDHQRSLTKASAKKKKEVLTAKYGNPTNHQIGTYWVENTGKKGYNVYGIENVGGTFAYSRWVGVKSGKSFDGTQLTRNRQINKAIRTLLQEKGGPGSGNHGHSGRPGRRGGSKPGGGRGTGLADAKSFAGNVKTDPPKNGNVTHEPPPKGHTYMGVGGSNPNDIGTIEYDMSTTKASKYAANMRDKYGAGYASVPVRPGRGGDTNGGPLYGATAKWLIKVEGRRNRYMQHSMTYVKETGKFYVTESLESLVKLPSLNR